MQIENFKENLVMKVRLEESQKARFIMEAMRKELDADYSRRLQNHLDRDAENVKRLTDQERQMNQSMYDARQLMQREIDDLRKREQLGARKIELESQGLKLLEVRLKEAQSLIEGRERDLSIRERKVAERETVAVDAARKEVREQMRSEMEQLFMERSVLAIERQKVQEERAAQVAAMVSASSTHNQLKAALEELVRREEEVTGLRKTLERLHQQRTEEEANLGQVSFI